MRLREPRPPLVDVEAVLRVVREYRPAVREADARLLARLAALRAEDAVFEVVREAVRTEARGAR